MHRPGQAAEVPWAFLFTLTAFLCAGFLSSAAAQSVAGTTWLSEKKKFGAFSTITFTADGHYSEIWKKRRPYGRWQASADNQQITVTLSNGKVLNFTFTADKNLIRATGHVVYKPTTAAAAAAASMADETDSSPPAPHRNVPTVKLTEDQARAVVLIKGDNSEGTGFLVKTANGPMVVTNIHVISNNPNLQITTNSGGPVIHVKSGEVIGVATEAVKVDVSDELDKASFANRNSAIGHSMRYFGFRIDNVPNWETYDWRGFQSETAFLDQFDKRSRCLDCYLNAPNDNKPEDTLWQQDPKIVKANSDFFDQASGGADTSQQLDADRVMWSEISDIASIDMETIQDQNNFYSFDRQRAKDEIAYRKALKTELDQINNNIGRLESLPRTNTN